MELKKVLIITYYWPPTGGGGVMRWLKFSKYLPEFGFLPIIYTPENPDINVYDESLLSEVNENIKVIKTKIWEPYNIYRSYTGKKDLKIRAGYISDITNQGFINKLSVFIRGNFLVPDPKCFWIKKSTNFLLKYIKENNINHVISTGPPHSMHVIALNLKKKTGIKWIADFRDPWTNIDFFDNLRLTNWGKKRHFNLEARVLKNADEVVTVTNNWAKDFEKLAGRKIQVIHNGYDDADFCGIQPVQDTFFSISHAGAFNSDRNPKVLWQVLGELASEMEDFKKNIKINLIGQVDDSVFKAIEAAGLSSALNHQNFLPHDACLLELRKSALLLLPINDTPNSLGVVPGKVFEYIASKRPIIVIGPRNGDITSIIKKTNAGEIAGFGEKENQKQIVLKYYERFKNNSLHLEYSNIEKYSRKALAKEYVELLN